MIGILSEVLNPTQTLPCVQNLSLQVMALEQRTVQSLRNVFNHWIRSLPMEERFLAVKIHASKLSKTIRLAIPQLESHASESAQLQPRKRASVKKSQKWNESKKVIGRVDKGFWQSLVLVSDGNAFLDNICIDYGLLECPEKLYDLLMATAENNGSHPVQEAVKLKRDEEIVVKILENCISMEQFAVELIAFLRQQVLLRFRQSMVDSRFIVRELEQEKGRKKQFSVYWKYLNQEHKLRLLLLGTDTSKQLQNWLSERGIELGVEELQKQIGDLLLLQKNEFCNRIFKCRFKKSTQPVAAYYQLVYYQWKEEVEKIRKKRLLRHLRVEEKVSSQQKEVILSEKKVHRRRQHRKSTSVQSNQTNETQNEKIMWKVQSRNYHQQIQKQQLKQQVRRAQYDKSYSSLEKREQLQQDRIQRKAEHNSDKKRSKIREEDKRNHEDFYNNQKGRPIKMKMEENLQNCQRQKIRYQKPQEQQIFNDDSKGNLLQNIRAYLPFERPAISPSLITEANYLRLGDQLLQMSDRISEEANEFYESRIIGFQRIQFLLQYYNIPIRLFGSCASGIAVKNSDIDIAIDNSLLSCMGFLPESDRIRAGLQWLQEIFKTQPCFTQIKLIKTAVIPVIKLSIDTSCPFLDPSIGEMYYVLNRNHCAGPLDADITIQTRNSSDECNHVGIISTNLINSWLTEIPTLHTVVIVMKQYFLKKQLNVTYGGGLNGFSMIVLFVAYINHAKLKEECNAAVVLEKILRFYGEEFDERKTGINLLNRDKGIFYQKSSRQIDDTVTKGNQIQRADLQMHDPMQSGKNMTRNCYLFPEIKRMFRLMIEECFQQSWKHVAVLANSGTARSSQELYLQVKEQLQNTNVFVQFLGSICDPI